MSPPLPTFLVNTRDIDDKIVSTDVDDHNYIIEEDPLNTSLAAK